MRRFKIIGALGGIVLCYFAIYAIFFDKNVKSYNSDLTRIEFRSSPHWVESESCLRGITLIGRPTTVWNYLFYPAEVVWFWGHSLFH